MNPTEVNDDSLQPPSKVGLEVVGAILILCSAFVFIAGVFMKSYALISGTFPPETSRMKLSMEIIRYVIITAFLTVVGVGTIHPKRWVRKVMHIYSWIICVIGTISFVSITGYIFFLFDIEKRKRMLDTHNDVFGIVFVILIFLFCLYAVLPLVLAKYYGNRNVIKTVEYYDPKPSWVDLYPAPVMVALLLIGLWFVSILMNINPDGPHVMIFGRIYKGWVGWIYQTISIIAMAWIVWGFYRLDKRSWWVAFIITLFTGISFEWNIYEHGLVNTIIALGNSPQPADVIKKTITPVIAFVIHAFSLGSALIMLGYLWYLRRYFPFNKEN